MKRATIQDRLDREEASDYEEDEENDDDEGETADDQEDDDQSTEATNPRTSVAKSKSSSIKIFVRVRPPRKNDSKLHLTPGRYICSSGDDEELPKIAFRLPKDVEQGLINNQKENYDYRFNRVFDQNTTQDEVFDHVAKDVIINAMDGYNGTIFAYGQTGSGKTFTITGGAEKYSDRGLIPRTLQYIFKEAKVRIGCHYEIGISYLEIYNECGYDLLDSTRDAKKLEDLPKVRLQEDESQTIHVQNLSSVTALNEEEALNLLFVGDTNRMIAETPSNPASSRSHCLFIINIMGKKDGEDRMWRSKLHLVDLAGSERTSRTGITGNLFKEASYINLSLHYLEQVIVALHEKSLGKRSHIPYRNSMMTSILRDSLGGNCMTTMIATVAPEDELIEESISTCRFAQRVALISNVAKLNEEVDPKLVIARLKREIQRLKAELAIARGETGDMNSALPDYEKEKVKQAVDDFVADTSSDASLIFSDGRKIAEAFRILKEYVLSGQQLKDALSKPVKETVPSPSSEVSRKEVSRLQMLIAHRDNEINVLIGMINKYKTNLGESKLLDVNDIKRLPVSESSGPSKSSQESSRQSNFVELQPQQTRTQQRPPAAPIPNLAASIPQLSLDKAKLFEEFKKGYPGTNWIEDQKVLLKGKYAEAKKLGELANELRLKIKHIKDTLGQPDDGDPATVKMKAELRSTITESVGAYKDAYQNLKDLKIEIEHMQHLLEQARMRLSRAFEQWYQNVYSSNPTTDEDDKPENNGVNEAEFHEQLSATLGQPILNSVKDGTPKTNQPSLSPSATEASISYSSQQYSHPQSMQLRPPSANHDEHVNRAHLAFLSSSSPYSSTSTLFINDGSSSQSTPRVSANILQQPEPHPPSRPTATPLSTLNAPIAWSSPPNVSYKSLQSRSASSLDRVSSSPPTLPKVSRSQTPQLTSSLKPPKAVGSDSKGVESDIEAFYQARDATSEMLQGVAFAIIAAYPVAALDNGVGRTPAMGWNSWNKFACNINEQIIRQHADDLVSSGLSKLGYNHVNIDDCWQLTRDSDGFIHEDPVAFPSGIKNLSDYVHSKGLKFGLYSSAGTFTCEGRPGGLHFEKQDAQRYAEWQIDYFKYDNCNNEGMGDKAGTIKRYGALRDALNATGRPVNYALCSWGDANVWEYGSELGNSWRTTGDIRDSWESIFDLIKQNLHLSQFAGPGGFNDMDMLEVGNGHMTDTEYRIHFSVWAALKSPLLLGHDIRAMTQQIFEIIGNKDVIAINQDPLGKSAFLRATLDSIFVWVGELDGGDRVLMVVNGGEAPTSVDVLLSAFTFDEQDAIASGKWKVKVKDLWKKKSSSVFKGKIRLEEIPAHGVKLLKVSRKGGDFPSLANPPKFYDTPVKYFDNTAAIYWLIGGIIAVVAVGIALIKIEYKRREGYQQIQ
ncbi:UNVERIFIED_CONTAM: Kinesin- protein 6 [Siphonaria sp. JEL0065]|nr:Kinesin- protein 6 [Siphonaria sp. JEL0065]